MKDCIFCDFYEHYKRVDRYIRQEAKKTKSMIINHEYSVALVERAWENGTSKRNSNRATHYKNKGIGYDLNFCPECGRQLKRGKAIVRQGNAVLDAADKND